MNWCCFGWCSFWRHFVCSKLSTYENFTECDKLMLLLNVYVRCHCLTVLNCPLGCTVMNVCRTGCTVILPNWLYWNFAKLAELSTGLYCIALCTKQMGCTKSLCSFALMDWVTKCLTSASISQQLSWLGWTGLAISTWTSLGELDSYFDRAM